MTLHSIREERTAAMTMSETSTQPMSIQWAEERLQTLLPGIYRGRTDEVQPVSMGTAPLAFDVDGNVAWDRMWGSFCDLAMAGGPPHKGKLLEPGTPESILAEPVRYGEVCDEIVRGIELAARSKATQSSSPGWLRVRCSNETMAGWLLRAITMENVSVRLEESAILLPAGPAFRVEKGDQERHHRDRQDDPLLERPSNTPPAAWNRKPLLPAR